VVQFVFNFDLKKRLEMKKVATIFTLLLFLASHSLAESIPGQLSETKISAADQEAFESCHRAAQKGDAQAMGLLGLMYEKGRGTPRDDQKAVEWLKKGALKGDAAAQNNLGFLYLKGRGLARNLVQAKKWFEKSAAQGLASAQENLGLIYSGTKGIPKDYEKAFGWFKKAAEQGDLEAQINLAVMYSLGEGGPRDYVKSYQWFVIALAQDHQEDAKVAELRDNIEWLEKRMTNGQVAEAKKLADHWRPQE
jgi:TPR repeat protein